MREAVRYHGALRLMLQAVVADGRRRGEGFLEVARLQQKGTEGLKNNQLLSC